MDIVGGAWKNPNMRTNPLLGPRPAVTRAMQVSFSCLVGFTLCCTAQQGGQNGDEGNDQTSQFQGNADLTRTPYCSRAVLYGPDGPGQNVDCHYESPLPGWREGDPTPAGSYDCQCDLPLGPHIAVDNANDCESALAATCDVDLEGPMHCSATSGGIEPYRCWPVQGIVGSWRCKCSEDSPLVALEETSCERAVLSACAATCADDTGDCRLQSSEQAEFDCNCAAGGSWLGAPAEASHLAACEDLLASTVCDDGPSIGPPGGENVCERVLWQACTPKCENGAGQCTLRQEGFECRCDSGDSTVSEAPTLVRVGIDQVGSDCETALGIACGFPPAGESCMDIDQGQWSCTTDGQGGWSCDCPTLCDPSELTGIPAPSSCSEAIATYCSCF